MTIVEALCDECDEPILPQEGDVLISGKSGKDLCSSCYGERFSDLTEEYLEEDES